MFLRFFQYFAKTTIFYQKRFEGVIFYYHYNLWFKYSKEWSGTSVRMLAWSWSFEQQAEKLKKWTNALHFQLCPQLFVACPNTFLKRVGTQLPADTFALRGPTALRPWIPIKWTVVFGTFQIRLKRICQFKRKNWEEQLLNETHLPCSQLLSDIYWTQIFSLPSLQKQNRFKPLAQARELILNLRNAQAELIRDVLCFVD